MKKNVKMCMSFRYMCMYFSLSLYIYICWKTILYITIKNRGEPSNIIFVNSRVCHTKSKCYCRSHLIVHAYSLPFLFLLSNGIFVKQGKEDATFKEERQAGCR